MHATILRGLTGATVECATLTGLRASALAVSARGAGAAILEAAHAVLSRITVTISADTARGAVLWATRAAFIRGADVISAPATTSITECQRLLRANAIPLRVTAPCIRFAYGLGAYGIVAPRVLAGRATTLSGRAWAAIFVAICAVFGRRALSITTGGWAALAHQVGHLCTGAIPRLLAAEGILFADHHLAIGVVTAR